MDTHHTWGYVMASCAPESLRKDWHPRLSVAFLSSFVEVLGKDEAFGLYHNQDFLT